MAGLLSHTSCSIDTLIDLDIFNILMTNEPNTSLSVISSISLNNLPKLKSTTLNKATSNRTLQLISSTLDSKVGEWDLIRVSVDDGRQAKVIRRHLVVVDVEFEVTAVVDVLPLQFFVGVDQPVWGVVCCGECDVLTVGAGRRYGGAGELDTDAVVAGGGVVVCVV